MGELPGEGDMDRWVCPNDRQLALRAKLGTGWSVHTNKMVAFRKNDQLSVDEQEQIMRVIQKAEFLEQVEMERIGRLVERVDNMKKNAMGDGNTQCILCGDEFGLLGASPTYCDDCKKAVCTKCGVDTHNSQHQPLWLCKICSENREAGRAASIHQDDQLQGTEQHQAITGEEEQQKITKYEDMFHRIKEATGVSDTHEVVTRFEYQEETTVQLEELKAGNEKTIERLKEEKEKAQDDFAEMKYTGEAKMSNGQRLLEEFEDHLAEEEIRCRAAQDRLEKNSHILTDVKTGMDHLAKKLKQVKAPSSQVQKSNISPASDEHVLDQLSQCEEKTMKLMEELEASGRTVDDIMKQMEEEEFHNTAESQLPTYNTRVPLKASHKDSYEVDSDSGDDEAVLTRASIKRQSQMMVDSKNKRRGGGGRRKKKNK